MRVHHDERLDCFSALLYLDDIVSASEALVPFLKQTQLMSVECGGGSVKSVHVRLIIVVSPDKSIWNPELIKKIRVELIHRNGIFKRKVSRVGDEVGLHSAHKLFRCRTHCSEAVVLFVKVFLCDMCVGYVKYDKLPVLWLLYCRHSSLRFRFFVLFYHS